MCEIKVSSFLFFQTWIPIYYGIQSFGDLQGCLCQYGSIQIHMGLFLVSLFCSRVLSVPDCMNDCNYNRPARTESFFHCNVHLATRLRGICSPHLSLPIGDHQFVLKLIVTDQIGLSQLITMTLMNTKCYVKAYIVCKRHCRPCDKRDSFISFQEGS